MSTRSRATVYQAKGRGGWTANRWLALALLATAQLMVILDASIVNIALPSAQRDLGISDANRQWMVTAYTLAFGGLLLLGGRVADYVGRKRIFVLSLIGFAVASALGGAAPDTAVLFAARALQGGFAALLAPAALALITVTFTQTTERARAFSVYGAISGSGAVFGLVLGGVLTTYASWRWCLLVNVPIALAAAVAGHFLLTESRADGDTNYDLPGAALVSAGLVSLVYGFTQAARPGSGWFAPSTVSFLALGIALLVAFVVVERRTANPLLPMRVVLDRNRGGSFMASLFVGAALFATFLFLTYYLQLNLHYSALKSGFAFLPFSVNFILVAAAVSALLPRTGPKVLMAAGAALAAAGLVLYCFVSDTSSWLTHILPGEILTSTGMSLVFIPLAGLALVGVDDHDAGVASAMLNTSQQIGGSLGTALLNTFYASAVSSYLASYATDAGRTPQITSLAMIHGYHVAFEIAIGMIVVAFLIIIFLIKADKGDKSTNAGGPTISGMPGCAPTRLPPGVAPVARRGP